MPELKNKLAGRLEVDEPCSQVAALTNFYEKFNLNHNRSILIVFILAVTIRLLFSIISCYLGFPIHEERIDFEHHVYAIYFLQHFAWPDGIHGAVPAQTYSTILALFYKIFGSHKIVGYLSSILAFCGSFWGIFNLAKLLQVRAIWPLMLFFSFLPTQVVFTSYALKEPWQLLSLIYSVLFFIRFIVNNKPWNLFLSVLALFFCACLHYYVLPIESVVLLVFVISVSFVKVFRERNYYLLKYIFFVFLIIFVSYKPVVNKFYVLRALTAGNAIVHTPLYGNLPITKR